MKTQTQTFDQLKELSLNYTFRGRRDSADAINKIYDRLWMAFVHDDGVRVLRDILKTGLMSPKNSQELSAILNQLDGGEAFLKTLNLWDDSQ